MTEDFWVQAAILLFAAVCFFHYGAGTKSIPITWRTRWEITQTALIVVALFALVSEGRGCTRGHTTVEIDCAAAADADC